MERGRGSRPLPTSARAAPLTPAVSAGLPAQVPSTQRVPWFRTVCKRLFGSVPRAESGPEKVLSHRLLPALCLSASPESSRGGGCKLGETCPYPELSERCRDGRTGTGGWSADSGRGLLCPPAVLERVGGCACVCTCVMSVCICVFRLYVPLYVCDLVFCLCLYACICVSVYGNICSLCECLCVCVSVCECVLRLCPAQGMRTQPCLASP